MSWGGGTRGDSTLSWASRIYPGAPLPESVQATGALDGGVVPWVVSARAEPALRAQARRLRAFTADNSGLAVADIGVSLAGRSAFEHRAVALGGERDELLEGLAGLAGDASAGGEVVQGAAVEGGLAFLFTGQGAQRLGMGRELHGEFPVFRAAFDEVCGHLDEHLGYSLRAVVFGGALAAAHAPGRGRARAKRSRGKDGKFAGPAPTTGLLDRTLFAQTGLFALELALFRLLESWGVVPDFVMGHSIGELAAACAVGVFSLEDGCALVAARGRLMGALPEGGAMAAIEASEPEVSESLAALEGWERRVALAAVNAPGSVVVSGDEDAVAELVGVWQGRGRRTRRLRVSHAFHSPRMDGMLEEFERVARRVSFGEPAIPVVSNLTGELATAEQLCDPRYWVRHVRHTVRFADGVRGLGRGAS